MKTRGELRALARPNVAKAIRDREEERDRVFYERYGMGYEEYLDYAEQEMVHVLGNLSNFDEEKYLQEHAVEITEQIDKEHGKGIAGDDSAGEEPVHGAGGEVLHREGSDESRRGGSLSGHGEGETEVRGGHHKDEAVFEETSGRGDAENGNDGRGDRGSVGSQRGGLAATGDVDDNGHRFISASNGSTIFGQITQDSGLTPAPIKLSEGFNIVDEDGNNHGYGLLHIEAGHGAQILEAGYASVKDFVENVTKNYQEIRIDRSRKGNETFMLLELHDEKHKRTLYVELSKDGGYWNVNSGGIFKNKYTEKNDIVWPEPTVGSNANTDTTEVVDSPTEVAKGETVDRGGNSSQPISSDSKVINKQTNLQENTSKTVWRRVTFRCMTR